jgi:hypothetical protein
LPGDEKDIRARSFVSDETLAIQYGNVMAVMSVDGIVLFQARLPQHRFAVQFVASSRGERFAAIEGRMRGLRSEPLDMYPFQSEDRVVVYSIPDRSGIFAVKLKGASPWPSWSSQAHVNQVALSPDGSLLALVADDVLKIYRLPSSNTVHH